MVNSFERPHSSAFGAAATAVQLMHHKRLMIDGIKRRSQRQRLQRRSRASHSDTATARMYYSGSLVRFQLRRLLPIRPCVSVGAVESVNVSLFRSSRA
jgi:hypothetical protein